MTHYYATDEDSARYRSTIGCCIWLIDLGRFDIAYAMSAMSRFSMALREGHLKDVKCWKVFYSVDQTDEGKGQQQVYLKVVITN
jgi:hypothetical protein